MSNFNHIIWDWQGVLNQAEGLNRELIDWIEKSDYEASILTNCGGDFSELLKNLGIEDIFKAVANPTMENVLKPNRSAYQKILKLIDEEPKNCLFVDDSLMNVKAAKEMGITSFLYKDNKSLFEKLDKLNK